MVVVTYNMLSIVLITLRREVIYYYYCYEHGSIVNEELEFQMTKSLSTVLCQLNDRTGIWPWNRVMSVPQYSLE